MENQQAHHLNDRTMKYKTMAQTRRQHEYLGLPGEYIAMYPQEIVFPNMDAGRVDSYYSTTGNLLINLEEESDYIRDKTLSKLGKYAIFGDYFYSREMYVAVICHNDPKKDFEYYQRAPSIFIKIHYIYFPQDELWEKYENVINKVEQKEKLTEMEALDIAFIPKFISKENTQHVIKSLTKIYNNSKIDDKKLKLDIGVILGGMILKHFKNRNEQEKLLERINMRQIKTDIEKLVYDEFGDELDAKDKEIEEKNKKLETKDKEIKTKDKELKTKDKEIKTKDKKINELNQTNNNYKNKVKELNNLKDLSPKAKQIIQSMMLIN